jgi:hypothetical protein
VSALAIPRQAAMNQIQLDGCGAERVISKIQETENTKAAAGKCENVQVAGNIPLWPRGGHRK